MDKLTLIFLVIAGLAMLGIVVITFIELWDDYRRDWRAVTDDAEQGIDDRLVTLESELLADDRVSERGTIR